MLVSLAALWAFAAWVTLRDGLNLAWVSVYNTNVAQPSESLLLQLQQERRLTMIHLADPGAVGKSQIAAQRTRTDEAAAKFRELASTDRVEFAADDVLKERIGETFRRLDEFGTGRKEIDAGRRDRVTAVAAFNNLIDSLYRTYESLATLDDDAIARDTRTLISLNWTRELISREDALLAGVVAARRFSGTESVRFTQIVGAHRYNMDRVLTDLENEDPTAYQQLRKSQALERLHSLEDLVSQQGRPGVIPPVTSEHWQNTTARALTELHNVVREAGERLVDRSTPVAVGVIARLVLAGLLGLVAVIASIILSITTARALVRQLEKLRTAAMELANERLPSVVARLAQGEKVDVAAEAPPLKFGDDVIGQVGTAFNAVQETAIRTAVEEAQLRQSIRDILLSLARRTQSLVHRQLTLLDVMERRESEPSELKDLFRIDHLATRMRRNAENLIVLAGASPARAWRRSVPMVDVVRGALAEVEDYTRVTVLPMGETALSGRAVGDVIHLLAELIENAVSFSPPYTTVQIGGQAVASGYAIEIEDRGLGMSAEDLAAANERIANPPEFNLSSTARLGLYVVSRLAERHGIRVALKASPYGGTTAVVLLPHDLVTEGGEVLSDGATDHGRRSLQPGGARETALVGAPEVFAAPVQEVVSVPTSVPEPPRTEPQPSEPVGTEVPRPASPASFTPSGLPFRVPQASLAPELAAGPQSVLDGEDDEDRSPEDIRKIMGSFQSGTRKGRSEAAKLLDEGHEGKDDQ
ncbi:nitrate- and nitrite sensing domain-containing protein [Sphaerimonospora mesophila]|uniref:sensor histidine kinase n=1 Tax=Sphaerimonospora mesophila TaxID=37483 RepID=UPI001F16A3D9